MSFSILSSRAKEKPQTRRRKTTSLRRSTGSVRRPDARPRTPCVLRVHLKGGVRLLLVLHALVSRWVGLFQLDLTVSLVSSDVLRTDTRRAGITCPVASTSATNVSTTTTEGRVLALLCSAHRDVSVLLPEAMSFAFISLLSGSHKDGYETFASWKKVWTSNGKSEPSLKAFMADQQLPFWVRAALHTPLH